MIDPLAATLGALNVAVTPFGKPEVTLIIAPPVPVAPAAATGTFDNNPPRPPECRAYSLEAPLTLTARPPNGVAVTVSAVVDSDCI
jgi:hypothetical protein